MWAWILHRFFNDFGVVLRSEIDVKWNAKRNWTWDRKKKGSRPHKDRPKRCQDAPGRSKASKLEPTWPQAGSQNRSKIDQNPSLGASKTQELQDTPQDSKMDPKMDSKSLRNRLRNPFKIHSLPMRNARANSSWGMQVCKYAGLQVCRYAGMQVCRYVGM